MFLWVQAAECHLERRGGSLWPPELLGQGREGSAVWRRIHHWSGWQLPSARSCSMRREASLPIRRTGMPPGRWRGMCCPRSWRRRPLPMRRPSRRWTGSSAPACRKGCMSTASAPAWSRRGSAMPASGTGAARAVQATWMPLPTPPWGSRPLQGSRRGWRRSSPGSPRRHPAGMQRMPPHARARPPSRGMRPCGACAGQGAHARRTTAAGSWSSGRTAWPRKAGQAPGPPAWSPTAPSSPSSMQAAGGTWR